LKVQVLPGPPQKKKGSVNMDAEFTVTLGVWVPKGFCEKNIAEQEWDNNNGFRDNTYILK
jgi:hypothetical protein